MNIYPKLFNKKNQAKLSRLINFEQSFFNDDILLYDDNYSCDESDYIILDDLNNNYEIPKDDFINYFE